MESSGFFNGDTEYGQDEFNRYFDNIYKSGIAMDDDNTMQYPVTIGGGAVSVGVGFAVLKGFYHYNDSAKSLTLPPHASLPQIYRVLIRLSIPDKKAALTVRAGSAASSPKPPGIVRSSTVYELSLGQYKVNPSGTITLVKDERPDQSVCGAIRPKNLSEYEAMMAEYSRQFEEWFESQQGEGSRQIYIQEADPGEAVVGSIWIHKLT